MRGAPGYPRWWCCRFAAGSALAVRSQPTGSLSDGREGSPPLLRRRRRRGRASGKACVLAGRRRLEGAADVIAPGANSAGVASSRSVNLCKRRVRISSKLWPGGIINRYVVRVKNGLLRTKLKGLVLWT